MMEEVPNAWDSLWEGPEEPLKYINSVARKASSGELSTGDDVSQSCLAMCCPQEAMDLNEQASIQYQSCWMSKKHLSVARTQWLGSSSSL